MKLHKETSQLVMIDIQERLAPAIYQMEGLTKNCQIMLEAANHLDIPILVTEQYRKGLGVTIAPLSEKAHNAPRMEKSHFSCCDDLDINTYLTNQANQGRRQFVLLGIEAHICVAQTALDLRALGHQVYIIADAVSSRAPLSIDRALERMRQADCQILTTEMALFEWLHQSGTNDFKKLSALIK